MWCMHEEMANMNEGYTCLSAWVDSDYEKIDRFVTLVWKHKSSGNFAEDAYVAMSIKTLFSHISVLVW